MWPMGLLLQSYKIEFDTSNYFDNFFFILLGGRGGGGGYGYSGNYGNNSGNHGNNSGYGNR